MNTSTPSKLLALYLGIWIACMPMRATAEDIDIFTGGSAGSNANPNILIVLDNSANWSRASQKWPGGIVQGQAEANAIKTVLAALGAKGKNVNIGLLEYGSSYAGYIRRAIKPMDPATTNVTDFNTQLTTIYNNITGPTEKVPMANWYGDLMYDAYNYYGGLAPVTPGAAGVANNPDAAGYTSGSYSQFQSPVSAAASCARNFIIFIGNPAASGPRPDTAANSCALYKLTNGTTTCPAGNFSPQLGLANFSVTGSNVYTPVGQTAQCYTSAQAGNFNTAIDTCVASGSANCYSSTVDTNYVTSTSTTNSSATGCSPYTQNCNLSTAVSNPSSSPMACPSGNSYHVLQTTSVAQANIITTTAGTVSTTSSPTTACYTSKPSVTSPATSSSLATATALNCPIESIVYTYPADGSKVKTDTTHVCTYTVSATPAAACTGIPVTPPAAVNTNACYTSAGGASTAADTGSLSCASGYTCSYTWGTPTTLCPTTSTTSYGTTTACYGSSTAASSAITGGTDIGGMTCPTTPLDAFGNPPVCSYALRSPTTTTACSATVTSATSSCRAAAPSADAAGASSVGLTACPSGSSCTYSVAWNTGCTGTVDPVGHTTGYYTSAPASFPNNVNNTASPVTETGTNLSCPAYTTCTYSVGGTPSSTLGNSSATGHTTNYYATSGAASTAVTGGTDIGGMTCPANYTCSYALSSPITVFNTATGSGTFTGQTTSYYVSSAAASTAITAGTDIGGMTCPANNSCSYAVGTAYTSNVATGTTAFTSTCTTNTPTTTNTDTKTNATASAVTYTSLSLGSAIPGSFTCDAWMQCAFTAVNTTGNSGGCGGTQKKFDVTSTITPLNRYNVTQTATGNKQYNITQTQTGMSQYPVTQTELMNKYTVTQSETKNQYGITQTSGPASTNKYTVTQTLTQNNNTYTVTQTDTPTVTVTTTPPPVVTTTDLGQSTTCYASMPTYPNPPGAGYDYASSCTNTVTMWVSGTTYAAGDSRQSPINLKTYTRITGGAGTTDPSLDTTNWLFTNAVSCAYTATGAATTTSQCPVGTNQYNVQGNNLALTQGPNGTFTTDTAVYNADEWAKLLFQKGVPVSGGSNATVSTYTIDVYNAQPNNVESGLYMSMAKNGGGKYYSATNESAIAAALNNILSEIQLVNSTFASASLPVNSTNRAQNANQVFIGMFRPDPNAAPRWFGNLKQYQIGSNGVALDLYDNASPSKPAINNQTGFLDDCAVSFWTKDSPTIASVALPWANNVYNFDAYYWNNIFQQTTSPASKCVTSSVYSSSLYSDIPDGAFVEKGAVAEVLRRGNDPTAVTPNWSFNRNMYTLDSSGTLVAYASGNSGLSTDAFHFTEGKDVDGDCGGSPNPTPCGHTAFSTIYDKNTNIMRPSVHGDVVHSRPLPINYGTSTNANAGVTAYYGANDGTFRAVVATGTNAGKELWAFTAPEFSNAAASRNPGSSTDPLTRLMNNAPGVNYPIAFPPLGAIPKDYFFDGSTGVYQNIDNTKVWIYPSMRRGGRMIYSFDVTNSNPSITAAQPLTMKWRAGCPDLTDDTGCTAAAMSGIGQTWSTPSPVPIKNLDGTSLMAVVFGGGYDNCEDADTASPSCGSGKGHVVYVLDADTGAVIKSFTTLRSVVADVSFVDVDNDGHVDYGYVLDTGGNVYRINFSAPANNNAPLGSANWTIQRIAYTSGGGRKFMWTPGLLPSGGKVYMAFASGDREHPLLSNYPYTSNSTATPQAGIINRLYVYLDDMVSTNTNLDDTNSMSNFSAPTTCDTAGIGSTGNPNKGWYMDFPGRGEQAVTSALIAGGMVTVSDNRPIPPASGTCSTALGEARGYWVNLFNASGAMNVTGTCGGDRSGIFVGGGLPPSPVIGTVPIDGVPTTVLIGAIQREGGASSPIAPQKLRPTIPSIRKPHYWKTSGDN